LLDSEERCGQCGDATCLEDFAGLETFPSARDLDADASGFKTWVEDLEELDDSFSCVSFGTRESVDDLL